jgi:hypothetical protein
MNPNNPKFLTAEKCPKFICEPCDFTCSKPSNYDKHLLTRKHENLINPNILNSKNKKVFECNICKHIYKHASTLSAHKKKCIKSELVLLEEPHVKGQTENEIKILTNMVLELVKSNTDLQKQMMEVCKNSNNTVIKNNNNNNKTFNLHFFLNEQCKDAMNLTEFIDTMELEFSDLEDVGKLGYVEGISKIMIRKLNELDIYKRPIHCSDAKREIMYVKEHNVWEKEKNSNQHIRKAIKRVTHKNGGLLVPWSLENPNCMNLDHHLNDVYLRMMGQSMGGSGEFFDNENKIMKKIAKAVFIDKM